MKTDTIDVRHAMYIQEDDGHPIDTITLVLNGEDVLGFFDAFEFVATRGLTRFRTELLNCSCGVPACAGIWEGVKVKRRRYTVEWRDIDCGFPKKFYNFKRGEYDAAIEKTLKFMIDAAKWREDKSWDGFHDYNQFLSVSDLMNRLENSKRWIKELEI
jgi:hypothetical protein